MTLQNWRSIVRLHFRTKNSEAKGVNMHREKLEHELHPLMGLGLQPIMLPRMEKFCRIHAVPLQKWEGNKNLVGLSRLSRLVLWGHTRFFLQEWTTDARFSQCIILVPFTRMQSREEGAESQVLSSIFCVAYMPQLPWPEPSPWKHLVHS